mmetsp:Transcript_12552/g.23501  ORF Transcript_12552/g.23501 Transcript_12552/m.23501 type:complete len:206 (+) Transcript_12552:327-944(+)
MIGAEEQVVANSSLALPYQLRMGLLLVELVEYKLLLSFRRRLPGDHDCDGVKSQDVLKRDVAVVVLIQHCKDSAQITRVNLVVHCLFCVLLPIVTTYPPFLQFVNYLHSVAQRSIFLHQLVYKYAKLLGKLLVIWSGVGYFIPELCLHGTFNCLPRDHILLHGVAYRRFASMNSLLMWLLLLHPLPHLNRFMLQKTTELLQLSDA